MSPAERKALKARAHDLSPILQLGEKGLTDAVVAEIDRALAHHELIKVRAAPLNRDAREVALASICERTGAEAVQHIGKMLIVYRPKPEVSAVPADDPDPPRARARAALADRRPSGSSARRWRADDRQARAGAPPRGSRGRPARRAPAASETRTPGGPRKRSRE
jgi:RNA-binding protein